MDDTSRHNQMPMRMVVKPAIVHVQDRMGSAHPFQLWIPAGKGS